MIDSFFNHVDYRLDRKLENKYSMQMIKGGIAYYRFIIKEMGILSAAFKLDWRWILK